MKASASKIVLLVLLGVALVLSVFGCGGTTAKPPASSTPQASSAASSTTSSTAETKRAQDLGIGEPATYGNVTVTVMDTDTGPKDKSGAETFQLTVSYANNGKEDYPYAETDWIMADAKGGLSQNLAEVEGELKTIGAGVVAPKGNVLGTLYFKSTGPITKVIYKPSPTASDTDESGWAVP